MASVLDFSNFSFTTEQVRAVKDLLYDEVIKAPEINLIHTVFNNIVFDKEIGFIGKGGLVGVAGSGCTPVAQAFQIATRKITWEPKEIEIYVEQCRKDIEATAAVYSMKSGSSYNDFTATDYMNIVLEVMAVAVKEFLIRLFWFNDTTADVVGNGGTLTAGTDKHYFNIISGFFKQMLSQVAVNPAQRVTISENAQATYVAQEMLPANAQNYLKELIYKAPKELRAMADSFIICTQSFYDAYEQSLMGINIESMYTNLTGGITTLKFKGKALIPIPIWDVLIATYYNNGTTLLNPNRAIFTSKSLLAVGFDSPNSFGDLDVWYDKDSRKVKIEGMGKADAKLANPNLFMLAI